jgi:two-component system sensor histidine kinase PilS (NtrC family)
MRGAGALDDAFDAARFVPIAAAYLAAAVVLVRLSRPGRFPLRRLAAVQVAIDLAALALLIQASGGPRGGLAVLLILPTAGAAILVGSRLALLFAALATLVVLGDTGTRWWRGEVADSALPQAAMVGAALLACAAIVGRLAARLAAQERIAWQRGEDLRNQLAVTRAVIGELPEGVVVLGAGGELRAVNRSAREMLAGGDPAAGALPGLLPLRASLAPSRAADASSQGAAGPVVPASSPGAELFEFVVPPIRGAAERRLRARTLGVPVAGGDTVVVLEDLGRLEERAQQLKLASMGRLSASIAHEIRNPLSAIRHANGLLAEQLGEARLQRLATIVEDNCRRIDRIVEDVLAISRRGSASPEALPAQAFLAQAIGEHVAQSGADPRRIACTVAPGAPPIWFDAGHLRQVLLNLLANALRHASGAPRAVDIAWGPDPSGRPALVVADDGPGVPAASRPHLFEPFFTTESRGTGLGLHLARELCSANGAAIRYRPACDDPPLRSAFVVEPAMPPRTAR